jgi:hypothetical protein
MTKEVARRKIKQTKLPVNCQIRFILQTVVIYGFVLLSPAACSWQNHLLAHFQRASIILNSVFLNTC